jgi:DNA-binding CsgD family transcriptional regulator
VAAIAEDAPVLLAVDDLQWSDVASIRALAYLARRIEGMSLGLLVSVRTGELIDADGFGEIAGARGAIVLEPSPLTEGGVNAAATDLLGEELPRGSSEVCHRLTGGNPLLLRLLLTGLRDEEAVLTPEAIAATGVLAPTSVARAVMLRLGRLSPDAIAVARAVAVLGDGCELRHVAAMSELDSTRVLGAAGELAAAGIFSADRATTFAHPLFRSAVYADSTSAKRALDHRLAAELLRGEGDAGAVASHLLATEPAGDERVVDHLREAATGAMASGAAPAAAALLARAAAEPPPEADRPSVAIELGEAELASGHAEAGVAHLREVLGGELDDSLRVRAAKALANGLVSSADFSAAVESLRENSARLGANAALRLELEAELAQMALMGGQVKVLADQLRPHRDLRGETLGERNMLAIASLAAVWSREAISPQLEIARRALGDGEMIDEAGSESLPYSMALQVLFGGDDLDGCDRQLDHALADARTRGSVIGFVMVSNYRANVAGRRGALRTAEAEAMSSIEASNALGDVPWARQLAEGAAWFLIRSLVAQGRLDDAERALSHMSFDEPPSAMTRMSLHFRGILRRAQGRFEEALADQMAAGRGVADGGPDDPMMGSRAEAAICLAALGRREEAIEIADQALARARAGGASGMLGFAHRARGLAGGGDERIEHLEQALGAFEDSPLALELASTRIDYGTALLRAGKRKAGRDLLEQGLDGAARCSAAALVERAREELKVAGARPRRFRLSGPESLTASERRVAEMAASGMSNREIAQALFVTTKAVEGHLTRTYRKLSISSRAELGAALRGESNM